MLGGEVQDNTAPEPSSTLTDGKWNVKDDDMISNDYLSDISDIVSPRDKSNYYSLEEINDFLDETFGKKVEVPDFFSDVNKFEATFVKIRKDCNIPET